MGKLQINKDLYDNESKVTKVLSISIKPLKLLIKNTGQILLIDGPRLTSSDQEEFMDVLEEIMKN